MRRRAIFRELDTTKELAESRWPRPVRAVAPQIMGTTTLDHLRQPFLNAFLTKFPSASAIAQLRSETSFAGKTQLSHGGEQQPIRRLGKNSAGL